MAQPYLLSAPPPGVESLLDLLEVKSSSGINDAVRDESLSVLLGILPGNADLQKIVAFSGGFEKALGIIDAERGIDGGEVVADCAKLLSTMLRFNVSNQNLFRELSLIPALPRVLHFPTPLADGQPAPDTFALQEWTDRKLHHAGQILSVIRILIGGPGGPNQTAMARAGVTRALLELALASNAPNGLKSQALTTLTPIMLSSEPNHKLLSDLPISPLVAIQPDNQHPYGGFVHVPPRPAAVALVAAVVEGDPTAVGQGLRSRAAGVNLFEVG